jgi:hypothetical protein
LDFGVADGTSYLDVSDVLQLPPYDNLNDQPLVKLDFEPLKTMTHKPSLIDVQNRVEKRHRRLPAAHSIITPPEEEGSDEQAMKRRKNTLAARKYRQRRQEETDVLAKRVTELEKELDVAKLEARWWKMEASRWQQMAQGKTS